MSTPVELNLGQLADKLAGIDRALPIVMQGTQSAGIGDVFVGKIATDDHGRAVEGVILIGRELDADEMEASIQSAQVMDAVDDYLERGGQITALLEWLESNP